ncbi:hypothetical protein OV320_7830 [Actinobacteria bacterium OV320]|jgi:hypothetical protein|nr:hypothetical protein OV320_7830 [Actinobacteria bacterium OV320]
MADWEVQALRNGRGVRIGVGYFHPDYMNKFQTLPKFVGHRYDNGVTRRVWCDRDGRAIMIGWFFRDWDAS